MPKLLIIMNPVAGTKKPNKSLTEIISLFCQKGYECQVQMTSADKGADKLVAEYGKDKDLVVCIGGDGTFNELVTGLLQSGLEPNVGYIPSGSTNDFASGMNISQNPLKAAEDIIKGEAIKIDVGLFNDRIFAYTASFGIFTKTSYNTPRDLKNTLGYLAYVLEGIKELAELQSFYVKIKSQDREFEGRYIYGGICNSRQIGGGFVKFSEDIVDMNDGLLEVLLIKFPKNPAELMMLLKDLQSNNYNGSMFEFFSAKEIEVSTKEDINWTLDGEFQKGFENIKIKNVKSAINLIINDKKK